MHLERMTTTSKIDGMHVLNYPFTSAPLCSTDFSNHREPPRLVPEHLAGPVPVFLHALETVTPVVVPVMTPGIYVSVVQPLVNRALRKCRALNRKIAAKTRAIVSKLSA